MCLSLAQRSPPYHPAGPYRVFLPNSWIPGLALSRAFGDFLVSDIGVVPLPDVTTLQFSRAAAIATSTTSVLAGGGSSADAKTAAKASGRNGSNSSSEMNIKGIDGNGKANSIVAVASEPGAGVSSLGTGSWDDPVLPGGDRHVLIVASDGLWEWVPNAAAVRIAASFEHAEDAAHALVEAAQKHWAVRYAGRNCDDITVAVAFLPADPMPA